MQQNTFNIETTQNLNNTTRKVQGPTFEINKIVLNRPRTNNNSSMRNTFPQDKQHIKKTFNTNKTLKQINKATQERKTCLETNKIYHKFTTNENKFKTQSIFSTSTKNIKKPTRNSQAIQAINQTAQKARNIFTQEKLQRKKEPTTQSMFTRSTTNNEQHPNQQNIKTNNNTTRKVKQSSRQIKSTSSTQTKQIPKCNIIQQHQQRITTNSFKLDKQIKRNKAHT